MSRIHSFTALIVTAGLGFTWPRCNVRAASVIDDFAANQATITGAGNSTQDGSILGGERDLQVSVSVGTISAGAGGGALSVTGDGSANGTVTVVWDGNDNDATTLANTGLAGQNFTGGGIMRFFSVLSL